MQIIWMRHGHAIYSADKSLGDRARILSTKGRNAIREAAKALKSEGFAPNLVYSSDLLRAVQSAEIAGSILGYQGEIHALSFISPEGLASDVLLHMNEHFANACLFYASHDPLSSHLISLLTGESIRFATADIHVVEFDVAEPNSAKRIWSYQRKGL